MAWLSTRGVVRSSSVPIVVRFTEPVSTGTGTKYPKILPCGELILSKTSPPIEYKFQFSYSCRTDIVHVWQDTMQQNEGPTYSAQMVLDSVNYLSETVYNISAQPSKALTGWVTDKMAPSYWRPNADIIVSPLALYHLNRIFKNTDFQVCHACKLNFERSELRKHHCRGCGEGFCNACSMQKMPVPSRGWSEPVRVCDACKDILKRHSVARPGNHCIHRQIFHTFGFTSLHWLLNSTLA